MYPKTEQEYTEMIAYAAVFIIVVVVGISFYKPPSSSQVVVYADQEFTVKISGNSYMWDISNLEGDFYKFFWFYNPSDSTKKVEFQIVKESVRADTSMILFYKIQPFDIITLNAGQSLKVSVYAQIRQPLEKTLLTVSWVVK